MPYRDIPNWDNFFFFFSLLGRCWSIKILPCWEIISLIWFQDHFKTSLSNFGVSTPRFVTTTAAFFFKIVILKKKIDFCPLWTGLNSVFIFLFFYFFFFCQFWKRWSRLSWPTGRRWPPITRSRIRFGFLNQKKLFNSFTFFLFYYVSCIPSFFFFWIRDEIRDKIIAFVFMKRIFYYNEAG